MPQRDLSHLTDILEAARLIEKRLSEKFRSEHPEIPWRQIAGMRDILVHA